MTRKSVHIHIGVDNVIPEIVTTMMRDLEDRNPAKEFHFVNDEEFGRVFRGVIASADRDAAVEAINQLSASSSTLLFSRPKFMYAGQPLNFPNSVDKSIYKLNFFQSILQNFEITIHVFLIDHISYLSNHLEALKRALQARAVPSWLPFISGIKENLADNTRLLVWNVENLDQVVTELYEDLAGSPSNYTRTFTTSRGGYDPAATEQAIINTGWDLELLDDIYEQDLQFILSGE